MSEAIIKSNELKTSLHHHSLERHDIYKAVLDIETLFPFILNICKMRNSYKREKCFYI
jgi:hypothetical protein